MSREDHRTTFAELYRRLDEAERTLRDGAALSPDERRRILVQRASRFAEREDEEVEASLEVLCFAVGGERYAVRMTEVIVVLETSGIAPLPGTPKKVLGALAARGDVVVVLDLRQHLGLTGGGMSDLSRVVVVKTPDGPLGLAAESVEGRLEIPLSTLGAAVDGPFQLVTSDRLAVLDLSRLEDPREG